MKIQNTLESIALQQGMAYSCNCQCRQATDTDRSDDNTADKFINPDDVNIIVPKSATIVGHASHLSDRTESMKDKTDENYTVEKENQNNIELDNKPVNEAPSVGRWQIIRTTPSEFGD